MHLGSVVSKQQSTTLYTDETCKYGHTYQSYLLTDMDRNSYLLGLREMVNNSGQCTLDTLKEILGDIGSYCEIQEEHDRSAAGMELLSNIKNTMSERASTEIFLTNFCNSTSRKSFQIFNLISTVLPKMNNN